MTIYFLPAPNEIKKMIITSSVIVRVDIVKERASLKHGYFRAKLYLINFDFVEIAEFFSVENQKCKTINYRYQWMDKSKKQLIKRWDNVDHFPDLPNFPHHIHIGDENNVEPGQSLSILDLIAIIENEISVS